MIDKLAAGTHELRCRFSRSRPEIFPLIKTGGLADVTGALPVALGRQGVAMRTLVPGYPAVMKAFEKKQAAAPISGAAGRQGVGAARPRSAGLDLLVLDAPHLFDRPADPMATPTGADWPDNWRRFAALSQAGADIAAGAIAGYAPDIVHAHDWQAALTLAYMRYGAAVGMPSVITVHNLAFQGQFGAGDLRRARPAGRGHGARRRRILRRRRLPQGRAAGGLGDHHGQPDLCAGDPHAGIRHGARRAGQRCARPICTASSTASTPISGIRQTDAHLAANYSREDAEEPRRQQAGGRGALRPRRTTTARSSAWSAG